MKNRYEGKQEYDPSKIKVGYDRLERRWIYMDEVLGVSPVRVLKEMKIKCVNK